MKTLFLALIVLLFSSLAFAELKGEFTISGEPASVVEGDLIEATLKVWPLDNPDTKDFAKLQNSILFNSLQLIQIHSIEPSANNADVLEVKGMFLARAAKYLTNFELNYKGELVQVAAPSIKVQADKNFLQPILFSLLSYLSGNGQNGAIISLHVTKTVEKVIIEIQQQQGISLKEELPAALTVYEKVLEDLGGELACTKSNTGAINYFRLKFCLA